MNKKNQKIKKNENNENNKKYIIIIVVIFALYLIYDTLFLSLNFSDYFFKDFKCDALNSGEVVYIDQYNMIMRENDTYTHYSLDFNSYSQQNCTKTPSNIKFERVFIDDTGYVSYFTKTNKKYVLAYKTVFVESDYKEKTASIVVNQKDIIQLEYDGNDINKKEIYYYALKSDGQIYRQTYNEDNSFKFEELAISSEEYGKIKYFEYDLYFSDINKPDILITDKGVFFDGKEGKKSKKLKNKLIHIGNSYSITKNHDVIYTSHLR